MFPLAKKLILRAVKGACDIPDARTRGAFENLARLFGDLLGNPNEQIRHDGPVVLNGPTITNGPVNINGGTGDSLNVNVSTVFNKDVAFAAGFNFTELMEEIGQFEIELTTDLWNNGGTAMAKRVVDGVLTGDAFVIDDPSRMGRNAFAGQRGWATKHPVTRIARVCGMNAPVVRLGTIAGSVASGASVTFTDATTGTIQFPVHNTYGLEDTTSGSWRIPSGVAAVMAVWHENEGLWLIGQESKCLELVP